MKPVVLDASVGVKWLKTEPGTAEALELLRRHGEGEIALIVPSIFVFEVLDVASRRFGAEAASQLWARLAADRLSVVPADASSFGEIAEVAQRLSCSTYDAAAVVVAEAIGAQLVSADARAHADVPGVRLIG